jgi:hypothetical protein
MEQMPAFFLYIEVKYTSALKENDLLRFLGLSSKLADAMVSSFPNNNFDRSNEYQSTRSIDIYIEDLSLLLK